MSTPFASQVEKMIPIPFDLPNEVTIKKLPGRHLEKAKNAFLASLVAGVQERGGAQVQKEMQDLWNDPKAAEQVEQIKADPLNGYDKYVLIEHGLVTWTYRQQVSAESIGDLDEDMVDWLAREILKLTKPKLFLSADEQMELEKNDYAPLPTH